MTTNLEGIRMTLDIAKIEIEALCELASAVELTLISLESRSLAAHNALKIYLNHVMAFFDPKENAHKTGFRAMRLNESKDRFLREIKSKKYNSQQQIILKLAYEKSKASGNALTYLTEVRNEEHHKSLMEKVILSDEGWKIGKGKKHAFACWKNSSGELIESDFNLLPQQNRHEKPGLPQRSGKRRTRNGSVFIFEEGCMENAFFKEAKWLPGCLMSNKGTIQLYGSSIHSFGGGSIFLSRESNINMENCKIIMEDGTFRGDLLIRNGKLNTIPYDKTSLEFAKKEIKNFTDRNVFVFFGNERVNLIEYLLSSYCICEDIFVTFKTLVY